MSERDIEERRVRIALNTTQDGVAIMDEDGVYEFVNDAFARIRGYDDPDTLVGRPYTEFYRDTEREFIESTVLPSLAERGTWKGKLTGTRSDGTTFVHEVTVTDLPDGGTVTVARDVTDRHEQERRLRTVIENAPVAIFGYDQEGTIEFIEGRVAEEHGIDGDELVGENVRDIFPAQPDVVDMVERALAGEHTETTFEMNGRQYKSWTDPVFENSDLERVVGTAVDITERVEYERGLRGLNEMARAFSYAESVKEVVEIAAEAANRILDAPISIVWRYDEERDVLVPQDVKGSSEFVSEADEPDDLTELSTGNRTMSAFREGTVTVVDYDPEDPNGRFSELSPSTVLVVPIGEYGVLELAETVDTELTELRREQAEILSTSTQVGLEHAESQEALARRTSQNEFFNSILRHDVLNGMLVIRARAEVLADELEGKQEEYAETIVSWCDDITEVVGQVRNVIQTLSSEGEQDLESKDLSAVLETELDRFATTYPAVDFENRIDDGLTVRADDLLSEVFGNLIGNAIEHNDPTDLTVRVTAETHGESVVVRIADDGRGIADDRKDVVFRRGETGHAKATGSGFGLFFVDTMVNAYGGLIRVEDTEDGGATFVVSLPTVGSRSAEEEAA
jgi:PAS domain S-box-containing protein